MARETAAPPTEGRPLVMSDVMREIQAVARIAEEREDAELAQACRRVQSILDRIRNQFVEDLVGPTPPAERPIALNELRSARAAASGSRVAAAR